MSRNLVVIAVVSLLSLSSCHSKGDNTAHLPPKQMEKLLLDIHLAETYCAQLTDSTHKVGDKNTDSLAVYYKAIFSKYGVTPDQFNQSLTWYRNHPEDFDTVYSNMIATAAKWQANMLPSSTAPVPQPPPTPVNKP